METQKSFADAFLHNFDHAKNIAEKGCKGLEMVLQLFTQRIDCELQYGKALKSISTCNHTLNQG